MKKWMIALMMAALLIVPMGGIAYAVGEGAPAAPAAGEFIPGDVPAQSGTMDAMVAPVNALVMCMVEQGLAESRQKAQAIIHGRAGLCQRPEGG